MATLSRIQDSTVCLCVDTKMGVVDKGWGVVTISVLVKDRLRVTTLSRDAHPLGPCPGEEPRKGVRRVQGRAWTSHVMPLLQAVIHAETTENYVALFKLLENLWVSARPHDKHLKDTHRHTQVKITFAEFWVTFLERFPRTQTDTFRMLCALVCVTLRNMLHVMLACVMRPNEDTVRQLHKDFHMAIESARKEVWPGARPVDDFFHFREKRRAIESRLTRTIQSKDGRQLKEFLGWTAAAIAPTRFAPSAQCFHLVWNGLLNRLRQQGEHAVADYLQHTYTRTMSTTTLSEEWNIIISSPEPDEVLSFCGHWSGVLGILQGMSCGSQPAEALHRGWETILHGQQSASPAKVLTVMERIYARWASDYEWSTHELLSRIPKGNDPGLINGATLSRVGRSTAMDFKRVSDTAAALGNPVIYRIINPHRRRHACCTRWRINCVPLRAPALMITCVSLDQRPSTTSASNKVSSAVRSSQLWVCSHLGLANCSAATPSSCAAPSPGSAVGPQSTQLRCRLRVEAPQQRGSPSVTTPEVPPSQGP